MTRWIAPVVAGLSLLVLLAGLLRAETETATTAGVSLVFWGLAGLALAGAGAGIAELAAAHRSPAPRTTARRASAARRPAPPRVS